MTATTSAPTAAPTAAPADVVTWPEPEGVVPRGTLVVLPGRGEPAGVYDRLGRRLSADGYRVLVVPAPTVDPAATADRVRSLLADAASGPRPRVLVGSDTGAVFAAALVAGGLPGIDTLPGIDALVLAGLLAGPADRSGEVPLDWSDELAARTACPTHQAALDADPQLRRGALAEPPPPEWLRAADPERIAVPVLGLHGAADTVAPLAAAREWFGRLDRTELVGISGGRHDALNDQTHRTAAATIVQFLERLRSGSPEIARVELVRNGAS